MDFDVFHRALHEAWREMKRPTHWLMTSDQWFGIHASSGFRLFHDPTWVDRMLLGLPVYLDEEVGAPGWSLLDTPVADRHRENELRRKIEVLQQQSHDAVRPLMNELVEIDARKPPRHFIETITIPARLGSKAPK